MAYKLDIEKPLFLGKTAVREGTVTDEIRKAVRDLDKGEGVKYSDLEAHLLANYKPKKSQNYSASFIKSYVRDGVNRYGHLSHTNEGAEYACLAAAEPKARSGKSTGSKKPSRAQEEKVELLQFIRDQGNVADAGQLDSNGVTVDVMVEASGRKEATISKMVDNLESEGLVRTESVAGTVEGDTVRNVYLTQAGYALANESAPEGAGTDEEQQRQENAAEATESQPA
jgi:hypothetical protein